MCGFHYPSWIWVLTAGNSSSMVGLLQRSTSAAQRMQVLECLQRDDSVTRSKLAADSACLAAIEEWVLDLIEDRMSFHVLETLLKVSFCHCGVLVTMLHKASKRHWETASISL